MESAVWGLIGTVVGALASIATTWLTITSSNKLQDQKVREERQERANAFQRETLLELQDAVHDVMRLEHRAYFEDCMSLRAGIIWSKATLSDELNEGKRLAKRRVTLLVERVADEDVRKQVKALMKSASLVALAKEQEEANALLEGCTSDSIQMFETLGTALRLHY